MAPTGGLGDSHSAEQQVLDGWLPPLNLKGISTEWTTSVRAARAVMAAERVPRRSASRASYARIAADRPSE